MLSVLCMAAIPAVLKIGHVESWRLAATIWPLGASCLLSFERGCCSGHATTVPCLLLAAQARSSMVRPPGSLPKHIPSHRGFHYPAEGFQLLSDPFCPRPCCMWLHSCSGLQILPSAPAAALNPRHNHEIEMPCRTFAAHIL